MTNDSTPDPAQTPAHLPDSTLTPEARHLLDQLGLAAGSGAAVLRPKDARYQNNYGRVLSASGKYDDAAAQLRLAASLDPRNAEYHRDLARTLIRKREWAEAAAANRLAIYLDPNHVEGHFQLGLALRAHGDAAGSLAAFREVLRLDPKHQDAGRAVAALTTLLAPIPEARP